MRKETKIQIAIKELSGKELSVAIERSPATVSRIKSGERALTDENKIKLNKYLKEKRNKLSVFQMVEAIYKVIVLNKKY